MANDRMDEQTTEQANERSIDRPTDEWTNDRTNERKSKRANGRTDERTNERMTEPLINWQTKTVWLLQLISLSEEYFLWVSNRLSKWPTEVATAWMLKVAFSQIDYLIDRFNKWMNDWVTDWLIYWLIDWLIDWLIHWSALFSNFRLVNLWY